jgi:hypothetical protein
MAIVHSNVKYPQGNIIELDDGKILTGKTDIWW